MKKLVQTEEQWITAAKLLAKISSGTTTYLQGSQSGPLIPEALANILHELHTYQIELELQNEELRQAQIELKKSQERYVDLYDFAPAGYVTVSEKGLIFEANITAADMLGIARGHLIRKPLSKFIADDDQDIYYTHSRKAMESRKLQACELRMRRKDGVLFWAKLECTPLRRLKKQASGYELS